MKEKIFNLLPLFFQNILIGIFNKQAYKKRYGGAYQQFLLQFKTNRNLSLNELREIQKNRFQYFLKHAIQQTTYYKNYDHVDLEHISNLPIISKEEVRAHLKDFYAIDKSKAIVSKTGGTTGKSLEVLFTEKDTQERFAILDDFRNRFGYELGKKTAWFSGKSLLTQKDISKNRFWKTDPFHHVRYYSTFHINQKYLKYYVENLIQFQPEYFVGFPSTILEIAKYGLQNGYDFPANTLKAVFPTAETVTPEMRKIIEQFFKTKMYDQYASSEGAPFIFECEKGNLHLELQSGVFEVLDDHNQPAQSGKLVITSFTTEGTPLIRYDIGDCITLEAESKICTCGNHNPLVKEILGRIDDYIYSPEIGKINLGNVSNTLKNTHGIIQFQAIQDDLNEIKLLVIISKKDFIPNDEKEFIKNWRERIGNQMKLDIQYVEEIPNEKSGKFRIVKNNIKHLI